MPKAWGQSHWDIGQHLQEKSRSVWLEDWWGWGGVSRSIKTQTGGEIQMECRLKRHRGHRRRKVLHKHTDYRVS